MARRRLDELCRAVLPPGYDRVQRYASGIQRFLEENLPPPANDCVTLLKIDDEEIVIAASSPPVASYLRMHANEIRQQLRETFGLEQAVRFRTVPDALLRVEPPGKSAIGRRDRAQRGARRRRGPARGLARTRAQPAVRRVLKRRSGRCPGN